MKKSFLSIFLATLWISISEFVRNTFILRAYWVEHYEKLGLIFPEDAINGAVWGIWSLCFAVGIFIISRKFSLLQTTFLAWFVGFVYMWLVIGNMGVLPYKILFLAIPLSLFETFIASWIIKKSAPTVL